MDDRKIVLVDIDGTLSKVGERKKYLLETPKNWDAFFEACDQDPPIPEVCELVDVLSGHYRIVFCTGRKESTRDKTVKWLRENLQVVSFAATNPDRLLMRKNGDHRHDTIGKPELLAEAGIKLEQIAFVLEDRDSMVAKWRELGLRVLQVAPGDF